MIPNNESFAELDGLLESLCEDRLTATEAARLEQIVLSSPEACWKYLTYVDLHGTLYWDTAGAGSSEPLSSQEIPVYKESARTTVPTADGRLLTTPSPQTRGERIGATGFLTSKDSSHQAAVAPTAIEKPQPRKRLPQWITVVSACLVLGLVVVWQASRPAAPQVAGTNTEATNNKSPDSIEVPVRPLVTRPHGPPIDLAESSRTPVKLDPQRASDSLTHTPSSDAHEPDVRVVSSREVVARINETIQSRWTELDIKPSPRSDDAEWLRRVYLDLIGRVPTVPEAEQFLADHGQHKRDHLIDQLLDDTAYVRNFTTKWTNLLIGRTSNPLVNRESLQKFLRLSFAANRPWNQIVAELISAEGSNTENGATNFLIAHLNNDATPATAVVSKLFLGRQMQCNQCHNNPFDETKQVAFWEMNSFFQQTTSVSRQRRDPETGRPLSTFTDLVTRDAGGPTYFETQYGLMRVAYPRYNGHAVDPSADTNRRTELARLMTSGDQPELAAAFVNRMWDHFFGTAFTRNVDDMGPHQPNSHPELLAALSEQFIRSGYDVKQLVRWICRSEPYHLSSRFSESNQNDDPTLGELPVFSRMYIKSMTAEQTYDSFLTATKAHQVGAVDWTMAERNRQQWLQQFVVAYHTDENDETMSFDGSIGNALSLMNGPLIDKALDLSAGSFLGEIIRQKSTENEKIRSLCLAALSRPPGAAELSSMRKLVRESAMQHGGRGSTPEAYQDLFWALLNSNEFALVH